MDNYYWYFGTGDHCTPGSDTPQCDPRTEPCTMHGLDLMGASLPTTFPIGQRFATSTNAYVAIGL